MQSWRLALVVFAGGGLGSLCRYWLSSWLAQVTTAFPLGTFGVNGLGCGAIGFFSALAQRQQWSPAWLMLLTTGFCGGFTTFSTFAQENRRLLVQGEASGAIAYTLASLLVGLGAVHLGDWLGRGWR